MCSLLSLMMHSYFLKFLDFAVQVISASYAVSLSIASGGGQFPLFSASRLAYLSPSAPGAAAPGKPLHFFPFHAHSVILHHSLHLRAASYFSALTSDVGASYMRQYDSSQKQTQQLMFFDYPDAPWSISQPALLSLLGALDTCVNVNGASVVNLNLEVVF